MEPKRFAILVFLIFLLMSGWVYAEPKQEIKVQVSILFVDSDGDGLSDEMEKEVHHTKPDNPDSDGDGYSDGAEVRYGGDPLEFGVIPAKGDLQVTANPVNAAIFLGGNWGYMGRFGGFSDVVISKLDVGRHVLRLSHPGYEDSYDVVQIYPPKNLRDVSKVHVELKPLTRPDYGEGVRLTSGGLPIDVGDSAIPVVCDWDNDGKKDLLVGNSTGDLILYRNTGSDASPDLTKGLPLIRNDTFLAPFVVDWDNDGKKDLLIGTRDGNVLFFRNTGSDDTPSIVSNGIPQVTALPDGYARPLAVDWNGDTKKDLLVGNGIGKINVFLNTGLDGQPKFDAPPFPALSLEPSRISPFVVTDWDGDGKKDILVGTSEGFIFLYLNQGTDQEGRDTFGNPIPIQSGPSGAKQDINVGAYASPFVADWNHDGMKDLLIGNGNGEILYYGSHWSFDSGTEPFSLTYPLPGMVFSTSSVNLSGLLNIPADAITVKVNGTPVTVTLHSDNSFDGEIPLVSGPNTIEITLTDKNGYLSIERIDVNLSGGDINQDGIVGIDDAFMVLQISSGAETTESLGLNPDRMDVAPLRKDGTGNIVKNPDGSVIPAPDGIVNVADALILLRAALGIIILPISP